MTAKRFIIMDNLPKGTHSSIWDNQKQHNQGIGDELWLGEVVAMLNEGVILADENEQLKEELDYWKKRALLLEKKYDEGDSVKWLRESKDAKTHLRPKRWKV